LVIFWKLVLTGEYSILWSGDNALQAYAWYQFLVTSLHQHSFPFWNPYSEAGRLFIGEPTSGAFYPFNLLLAILPQNARGLAPAWGLEYMVVIHFFLASFFTYLLGRHLGLSRFGSLVGGITFAYSGSLSLRYFAQITVFTASVWIPAVFLCYSKAIRSRRMAGQVLWANLGGLALALGILAGHHQPVLYCGMALAVTGLVLAFTNTISFGDNLEPRPSRFTLALSFILLGIFAVMYSCLQLVPSLQYAHYAYRWVGLPGPVSGMGDAPYSVAGTLYGLAPQNVLLLLFPFHGNAETNLYFGICPLLLVALSLTRLNDSGLCRLLWLIAAMFFLLALGAYTPLHGIFYYLLPGFSKAREAARALVLVHFAFALLAAIGYDELMASFPVQLRSSRRRIIEVFTGVSILVTVILCVLYLHALVMKQDTEGYDWLFFSALLMLMTSAIALCRVHAVVTARALQAAIVLALVIDFHGIISTTIKPKSGFNTEGNYEATQWFRPDEVVQFIRSQPGVFRTNFDNLYPRSIGEVLHLDTVNGYGATEHKSFGDLMGLKSEHGPDLLNIKYVVTPNFLPYNKVFQKGQMKVYENPGFLPRAWLVSRLTATRNSQEMFTIIKSSDFDIRNHAVAVPPQDSTVADLGLEQGDAGKALPAPEAKFARESANRFSVDTQPRSPSFLVVSETWYPGWHARVNGREQRVWQVDGSLMGLPLQPETAHVEFWFRPDYLNVQLLMTGLAALLLALAFTLLKWTRSSDVQSLPQGEQDYLRVSVSER
jgi:hypothetical protein